MKIHFSMLTWLDRDEAIITVSWDRTWPLNHFLARPKPVSYRGQATVWHEQSTGSRCPTYIEATLDAIWTRAIWARSLPGDGK